MAVDLANLALGGMPGGPDGKRWFYTTTDDASDTAGTGYFNAAAGRLSIGDIVDVVQVDDLAEDDRDSATATATLVVTANTGSAITVVFEETLDLARTGEVSPLQYGAVGDGVTDDTAAFKLALQSGKVVNGGGLTYGITATCEPSSFTGGLINCKLIQLTPLVAHRTLFFSGDDDWFMRDVEIDQNGGTATNDFNTAAIWCDSVDRFTMDNVRIKNGGPNDGFTFVGCTDGTVADCHLRDYYWELAAASDDVIQGMIFVNCSKIRIDKCSGIDLTGSIDGADDTNRWSRMFTFSGCSEFQLSDCYAENTDQGFDCTGSSGNSNFTFTNCIAKTLGTYGFKQTSSSHDIVYSNCIADRPNRTGFFCSGGGTAIEARNVIYNDCLVHNCGYGPNWSSERYAFRHSSTATLPDAVLWNGCQAIDDQLASCTISQASPGVVTAVAHGRAANARVRFFTTGALPSPLVAGALYFVKTVSTDDTFTVSYTIGGTAVITTDAGSGTHTAALPTMEYGFFTNATGTTNVGDLAVLANCRTRGYTTGAFSGFQGSPRTLHTGNIPATSTTFGTEVTASVTEAYFCEFRVEQNTSITGVALLNGSTVAGVVVASIADINGKIIARTNGTGVTVSGTDQYQRIALAYQFFPGTYYLVCQFSNATNKFRAHPFGNFGTGKDTGVSVSLLPMSITVPSTFTADLGPVASFY